MTTITVRLDEKDKELYQKAVTILNNGEPTISFDEMMKEIGLDDV